MYVHTLPGNSHASCHKRNQTSQMTLSAYFCFAAHTSLSSRKFASRRKSNENVVN